MKYKGSLDAEGMIFPILYSIYGKLAGHEILDAAAIVGTFNKNGELKANHVSGDLYACYDAKAKSIIAAVNMKEEKRLEGHSYYKAKTVEQMKDTLFR